MLLLILIIDAQRTKKTKRDDNKLTPVTCWAPSSASAQPQQPTRRPEHPITLKLVFISSSVHAAGSSVHPYKVQLCVKLIFFFFLTFLYVCLFSFQCRFGSKNMNTLKNVLCVMSVLKTPGFDNSLNVNMKSPH